MKVSKTFSELINDEHRSATITSSQIIPDVELDAKEFPNILHWKYL